jgi:hypothetical protein
MMMFGFGGTKVVKIGQEGFFSEISLTSHRGDVEEKVIDFLGGPIEEHMVVIMSGTFSLLSLQGEFAKQANKGVNLLASAVAGMKSDASVDDLIRGRAVIVKNQEGIFKFLSVSECDSVLRRIKGMTSPFVGRA